ncbi:MAG: hypothetical protein ICV73_27190, partial [Acetobacteraceae bacterium]|nr:hypothetical protein [Acetobacteraceae bacterium]
GQSVLPEPEPLLRRIRAPTLLVWGEKDALVPFRNAADYAVILPDSATVSFPELGHVPQEEAPARSLEPVKAFLARPNQALAPSAASAERRSGAETH